MNKQFFYEGIAGDFDELMNAFDVRRRLEVVYDQFLTGDLAGVRLLDVGCGTGRFSERAHQRGAEVVALDVGPNLLKQALARADVSPVVGDGLRLPFQDESFDVVVSSEMIEHTTSPVTAVGEMARVLRPGGRLALTCPNKVWLWLVRLATTVKLRPFDGYENFPSFPELERFASGNGLRIRSHIGLHPWPFQFRLLCGLSRWVDMRYGAGPWSRVMINQAILADKP